MTGASSYGFSSRVALTPTLSQREREQEGSRAKQRPDETKAERSDGPSEEFKTPSGRAEKRRAWGGHVLRSKPMLCALTRCGCLSEVNAVNDASSAAPPHARASQVDPKRSAGDTASGVAFSLVTFFLARQKESDCAAGRTSRPATHPTPQPLTSTLSPKGRGSIRAARQVHGKNRPRSYQHPQATPLANIASFAGRRRSLSSST